MAGLSSAPVQLLVVCAVVSCACAKEYILQDLIAMETNHAATRNAQQHIAPATDNRKDHRLHKTRAVDGNKTATAGDKDDDDEDKKTLAQQVADGKYGLIQKELFIDPPQRPGIISYEVNPEVPKDNVNNLGGLKPEEIWLAENHLLVLAGGGGYNDRPSHAPSWPPIDNYKAPPRQVKIPPEPKVPPPFPIQLKPGGPVEFIRGANGTGGPPPFLFFPPPPGNFTGGGNPPFFGPPINALRGNFTSGNGPIPPFPFPPFPTNGSLSPAFGPGPFPPPGANFPPPPVNGTGPLDEDDPSIYYPPPYDFVYKKDNTSAVPPGPLVPGIVLPPPPDFFAPLEDEKRKTKRPPHRPKTVLPERPRRPTTKRPAVKIVTDDPSQHVDLNEVTPTAVAHALPPDAVVQGWVPIPAPRPFYITGIGKPHQHRPRVQGFSNGYEYRKPQDPYLTPNDEPKKWIDDYNASRPVYLDQSVYYRPTTTTTAAPLPQKGKAIKAFYFYDEPNRIISTTVRPTIQSYYPTERPSQYYDDARRPLQYFYITKPPPTAESTTARPPVFEYSYTAPGYGTLEAPRLTVTSTAAPPVRPPAIQNLDPYDNYYDYELRTPSSRPTYTDVSTASPVAYHSVTSRPLKTDPSTTRTPYLIQTENPYHAYFTHHDYSLIDDITKKYFTIFGQKLNGDTPTTPLSGSVEDVTSRPVSRPIGTRVKFPAESPIRHTTPHAPIQPTYWSTSTPAPLQDIRYQQYPEYDYYYGGRGSDYEYPVVRDYYDNRQHGSAALLSQQPVSYEGDTRVNNIRPYPKDPDAEEFAPHKAEGYLYGALKSQAAQSLRQDTRVNYVRPQRPKDPDAEELDQTYNGYNVRQRPPDLNDPQTRQRLLLRLYKELIGRHQGTPYEHPPPSLVDDIKVNDQFLNQNVTAPPDVEVFDPKDFHGGRVQPHRIHSLTRLPNPPEPNDDYVENTTPHAGVVAYKLPGNGGGHFYFLTPQPAGPDELQQNLYRRQNVRRRQSNRQEQTPTLAADQNFNSTNNNDSNQRTIQR